jgi:hypothetical protein
MEYILTNFILCVKRNFKNVTIELATRGRWFSPASSTTKTGRHDIDEILLKVALIT